MTSTQPDWCLVACIALAVVGVAAVPTGAGIILSDGNSSVSVDLASSDGLSSWTVNGVEHMGRQWFWYRVGPVGGEMPINALTLDSSGTSDINFDGQDETLHARYVGSNLTVEVTYSLTGSNPGDGTSDVLASVRLTNTGAESMDLHFFQYADFNLNGDGTSDVVQILQGNTARQIDGGFVAAETVSAPAASHYEVGPAVSLFTNLNDFTPTVLADLGGPVAGDVAWAFQWDNTVEPGKSVVLGKDMNLVPEPAAIALLGVGVIGMMLRPKRRRR